MTKKHFRELAKLLHGAMPNDPVKHQIAQEQWEMDIRVVADVCAQANPNFNRDKFLTACREGL